MNEIVKAMIERRSCRKYKPEQIKDEDLQQILEAGKYAATGHGWQSPKMVVIQNPEIIAKLSKWNAQIMGVKSDPFYGVLRCADRRSRFGGCDETDGRARRFACYGQSDVGGS